MSKKGAHTVNPLPMRSMAALLKGICAGNFEEEGASSKWDSAIEVSLARLLFPGPNE